ncbi:MAG: hypothetical protein D6780_08395, partial [Candidatus Dadabacteria bacterium]
MLFRLPYIKKFTKNKKEQPLPAFSDLKSLSSQTKQLIKEKQTELLNIEQLASLAESLSEKHQQLPPCKKPLNLLKYLAQTEKIINTTYRLLTELTIKGELLPPGSEWLLDNYHIIYSQFQTIKADLSPAYYKKLSFLGKDNTFEGCPKIFALAVSFLQQRDFVLNLNFLTAFLNAYQKKQPLTIAELWAFPIMLRIALLEQLKELIIKTVSIEDKRLIAEKILEDIFSDPEKPSTKILSEIIEDINKNPDFFPWGAAYLLKKLAYYGRKANLALAWLEEKLREEGYEPELYLQESQAVQASNQLTIGNIITSLRLIDSSDWSEWFEQVSTVEKILRKEKSGIYKHSSFSTRDLCRQAVEKISRKYNISEITIAEKAKDLANQAYIKNAPKEKEHHVGFYLIDKGINQLLSNKLSALDKFKNITKKYSFNIFLTNLILLTLCLTATFAYFTFSKNVSTPIYITLLILSLIPFSEISLFIIQWISSFFIETKIAPRYDYSKNIPEDAKTAVIVHAVFDKASTIYKVFERLQVHFVGNQDKNLLFGVLADFSDSPTEQNAEDKKLENLALQLLNKLNSQTQEKPFFLMLRKRVFNPSEKKYLGWERKRGKIEEFNRFILKKEKGTFKTIAGERIKELHNCKFVITLDFDTDLPYGSAKELIGIANHPLNEPFFDNSKKKIIEGASIIQPRPAVSLESAVSTYFSWAFSGPSGLDPYTKKVFDFYQDVFDEGSYLGKGIYRVKPFYQSLEGKIPENALLSHDLFEGLFARVRLASDIELPDQFPSHYATYAAREERWIRGDWQLLPWTGSKAPNKERKLEKNIIHPLGKWKLIDNLRRSLVAPSLVIMSLASFFLAPSLLPIITSIIIILLFLPILSLTVNKIKQLLKGGSFLGTLLALSLELKQNILKFILRLSFLAYEAFYSLKAIFVTLFRLYITKKHLLQWQRQDLTERRLKNSLITYTTLLLPSVLIAILTFSSPASTLLLKEPWLASIPVLWLLSPILAYLSGKPYFKGPTPLQKKEEEFLKEIARETWYYFDDLMQPTRKYLIPDNIQEVPELRIAERTSTTNIGLSLTSVIAAYEFGFTSLFGMINRVKGAINTLTTLERHRGHFYNWYETTTGRPLHPKYISTVDSGNFAATLLVLHNTLLEVPYSSFFEDSYIKYLITLCEENKYLDPNLDKFKEKLQNIEATLIPFSCEGVCSLIKYAEELLQEINKDKLHYKKNRLY